MYVLLFIQLRVFFEVHSGQVLSRILSLLIFSCLEWEQSIIVCYFFPLCDSVAPIFIIFHVYSYQRWESLFVVMTIVFLAR